MADYHFFQSQVQTLKQICDRLEGAALRTRRSFHLEDVVTPHNQKLRNKALTILLVYGHDPQPASLVIRGHTRACWVKVERSVGHTVSAEFMTKLETIILSAVPEKYHCKVATLESACPLST